jgi:hypothetical protein
MEPAQAKAHLEFNVAAANRLFEQKLQGEQITSPYDLWSVERLRDQLGLRQGRAVPTDVFVFGFGPAPTRLMTCVSGLPYWPAGRAWPMADERPCQFLAQFCFLDSADICGELPGDVLLLFVPPDEDWLWEAARVQFEWVKYGKAPVIPALPTGVEPLLPSSWYGVRSRTFDYPDAVAAARQTDHNGWENLPVFNATKIGGVAHNIQPVADEPDADKPAQAAGTERFLCQLTSIQAHPNVPYPWCNRPKPLTLSSNADGIYADEHQCLFGDMGTIYVYLDPAGACRATMECY